ncbi:MAG: SUF system Fe-S cluster assembly regulator [Gammaproteobacteria bacterium]
MSKLADYAALMLATMAERPTATRTAAELAAETGISPPTVSKLLKMLGRADLVISHRGAHGGYALARAPAVISAVDVIEAIEGPLAVTECTLAPGLCELEHTCQLSSQWQHLSVAVRRALAEITLEDLIGDPISPQLAMRRRSVSKPAIRMELKYGNA